MELYGLEIWYQASTNTTGLRLLDHNEYRQEPTSGTIKLTVQNIYGQDAKILEVEDGFTCCKTESVSYIGQEKFELAYTLMRADKFEFIIKRIDY